MIGGKGSGRKGGNPKNESMFRRLKDAADRKAAEEETAEAAKKAFEDAKKNDGKK